MPKRSKGTTGIKGGNMKRNKPGKAATHREKGVGFSQGAAKSGKQNERHGKNVSCCRCPRGEESAGKARPGQICATEASKGSASPGDSSCRRGSGRVGEPAAPLSTREPVISSPSGPVPSCHHRQVSQRARARGASVRFVDGAMPFLSPVSETIPIHSQKDNVQTLFISRARARVRRARAAAGETTSGQRAAEAAAIRGWQSGPAQNFPPCAWRNAASVPLRQSGRAGGGGRVGGSAPFPFPFPPPARAASADADTRRRVPVGQVCSGAGAGLAGGNRAGVRRRRKGCRGGGHRRPRERWRVN